MVSDWLLSLCPPDPTPLHPGTPSGGLDSREQGVQGTRNLSVKKVCPLKVEMVSKETTLMAEIKEELKSLLMKVKEESEKGGGKNGFTFIRIRLESLQP